MFVRQFYVESLGHYSYLVGPDWMSVHELRHALAHDGFAPQVLDVRSGTEWQAGHIAGAIHIPGGNLEARRDEVPADRSTAIICGTGYRSSVGASILQRHGRHDVLNVVGGMTAWQQAEYPIITNG